MIKAIIDLAEKAAKEPRDVKVVDDSALEKEMLGLIEQELRSAYAIPIKQDRYAAVGKAKEKVMAHYFPEGQEPKYDKLRDRRRVQGTRSRRSFAGTSSTPASASMAATSKTRPQHHRRSRLPAARPRLGAVHPR